MIYEDILCMEKEINIVVEKLKGMWQIAESNIGKYMLIKASWTVQLQIASEHANCEMMILCCRAQLKKVYVYNTWWNKQWRRVFCFGYARSICQWSPNSDWTIERDYGPYLWPEDMTIFSVVKNLGYCNTEKKFNNLFMKYRRTILPKMRSDSETLASNE